MKQTGLGSVKEQTEEHRFTIKKIRVKNKRKHEQTNAETVCKFKAERSSNILKHYRNYLIFIHINTKTNDY